MRLLALLLIAGGAAAWWVLRPSEPGASGAAEKAPGDVGVQTGSSYLSPGKRRLLFDLERADLLLGKALDSVTGAVKKKDRAALQKTLAEGFTAVVPDVPALAERGADRPTYFGAAHLAGARTLSPDAFLGWAADLESRFDRITACSFGRTRNAATILEGVETVTESAGKFRIAGTRAGGGVLEVAGEFTLRHGGMAGDAVPREGWVHGLVLDHVALAWSEKVLFEEITDASGIDVKAFHDNWRDTEEPREINTGGVLLGRVNGDEHLDVLVTEPRKSRLYFGDGTGRFADSGWTPPDPGRPMVYAAIFDADGDGRTDVLYGGHFYRWNGAEGRMEALPGAGEVRNADGALCDYDRDGNTDIYLLHCGARVQDSGHSFFDDARVAGSENRLVRNLGGAQFEDVTDVAKVSGGHGRSFAATWLYANDDPWPDLFAANEFGRNSYFLNRGGGRFEEQPDVDPRFGGLSMGVTSGDLTGDGIVDLYVSNMYSKAGQRVFSHLDPKDYPPGTIDLFKKAVSGNSLYRGKGDGTFEDISIEAGTYAVGWAWSGALADFDLDGNLDVYAPCGHTSVDKSKPDG